MIAFRVHQAAEAPATVLDPGRPDEWVASDESYESQPHGVSACATLDELARYARKYSMQIQPGDRVIELRGREGDEDRDEHAVRVIVKQYRVLGDAADWLAAWSLDLDEIADASDAGDDVPMDVGVQRWLRLRLDEGGMYDARPDNIDILLRLQAVLPAMPEHAWRPL